MDSGWRKEKKDGTDIGGESHLEGGAGVIRGARARSVDRSIDREREIGKMQKTWDLVREGDMARV